MTKADITAWALITHLEARAPGKLAPVLVDVPIVIQDVDEVQPMPLAGRKIVRVVRGRDFDGTRSECHVHELRI